MGESQAHLQATAPPSNRTARWSIQSAGSTQYHDDIVHTKFELKHKVPLSVGNHLIAELIAVTLDVAGEIGIHWYCTV